MHKKALTVAIAGALAAAPLAANAVDFTISGQVAHALVMVDPDVGDSETKFGNYGWNGSRLRVTGSSEAMDGVTAGVNMEFDIRPTDAGDGTIGVRHAAVSLGGDFGTIKFGQTSEASDGAFGGDKSGVAGATRGEGGSSKANKYTIGASSGRQSGLHYSSMSLGPASFHFSVANDERFSAKVTASGDAGVASYDGRLGYLDNGSGLEEITGGLGVQLASGVTVSFAGGAQSGTGKANFMQAILGYKFGDNAVGVGWYGSSDVKPDGMEMGDGQAIGIGFKHSMPMAGVDIYASVRQISADVDGGTDLDDTVAFVATQVSF